MNLPLSTKWAKDVKTLIHFEFGQFSDTSVQPSSGNPRLQDLGQRENGQIWSPDRGPVGFIAFITRWMAGRSGSRFANESGERGIQRADAPTVVAVTDLDNKLRCSSTGVLCYLSVVLTVILVYCYAQRVGGRRIGMSHVCNDGCECAVRMDAATDMLALASSRLKDVIFSGSEETIDSAHAFLRFARMRFLEARADCREISLFSNA
jgi:hypothetical protein